MQRAVERQQATQAQARQCSRPVANAPTDPLFCSLPDVFVQQAAAVIDAATVENTERGAAIEHSSHAGGGAVPSQCVAARRILSLALR